MRLGEILALRVGRDIDLTGRSVTVRETRGPLGTTPPKSRRSHRRVSLAPRAAEVLACAIAGIPDGELAFPYNLTDVSHSMPAACKRAGVKRIRFHDLRHTHASLLLAAGENVKLVSARLGHASINITLDTYQHLMPGTADRLANVTAAWE